MGKQISNTFIINTVQDGVSQPSYIQTQEAWSNAASTASESTEPTPNGGWYDHTPPKGTYAYLWRRSRVMTLNATTREYQPSYSSWTYTRLSGTNGTSIAIKGHVATVSALPSSHSDGDAYVVDGDNGKGERGHLFMWSNESASWIDIGKFQGDAGVTYFTHVAWASAVTLKANPTSVTGQQTKPNASEVEGFSISPDSNSKWMGVLVNTTVDDSTTALDYTWSESRGAKGDNGKTYRIAATQGSVTIAANATAAALTNDTFTAYMKDGAEAEAAYPCYFSIFRKKGSSYALLRQYTAKATVCQYTNSAITAGDFDAIVVCIYDSPVANHGGYLAELEIPVYKQGDTGAAGGNSVIVMLYQRSDAAVSKPANRLTYNFADKTISSAQSDLGAWRTTMPGGASPLYVTVATAYGNTATADIEPNEWSDPVVLAENGAAGLNTATVFLFRRAAETASISKPTGTIRYTFETGTITVMTGSKQEWELNIPANPVGKHVPCWAIRATAASTAAYDDILSSEWSAITKVFEDGASASEKTELRYALSAQTTTASATVEPDISGSWQTAIPQPNASFPYVWVRSQYYSYNGSEWVLSSTTYSRITGESGTGVAISGTAVAVAVGRGTSLPNNGNEGDIYLKTTEFMPYIYQGGRWAQMSLTIPTNAVIIAKTSATLSRWQGRWAETEAVGTGAAYISDWDKHLYLWQGTGWQDCGVFRGDNGEAAYVHLAWADVLDLGGGTYPSYFVTSKDAAETYRYMGIYTDHSAGADSKDGSKYEWMPIKGADSVTYTIQCADTIKPSTASLPIEVTRAQGADISTKDLTNARSAWGVHAEVISSERVSGTLTITDANGLNLAKAVLTAASVITLGLIDGAGAVVAKRVIRVVADGERGSMSRNIYYAGTWEEVRGEDFDVDDYSAPYVNATHTETVGGKTQTVTAFYVYVGDNGNGMTYPLSWSGYQNSGDWRHMETQFKYMINEAVFSVFAKLGSWVFNGDYMFSQQMTDGTPDYRRFEGFNADGSAIGKEPNIWLDALHGKAAFNDVTVRGTLEAKSLQTRFADLTGKYVKYAWDSGGALQPLGEGCAFLVGTTTIYDRDGNPEDIEGNFNFKCDGINILLPTDKPGLIGQRILLYNAQYSRKHSQWSGQTTTVYSSLHDDTLLVTTGTAIFGDGSQRWEQGSAGKYGAMGDFTPVSDFMFVNGVVELICVPPSVDGCQCNWCIVNIGTKTYTAQYL